MKSVREYKFGLYLNLSIARLMNGKFQVRGSFSYRSKEEPKPNAATWKALATFDDYEIAIDFCEKMAESWKVMAVDNG